jgi:hypothetical protein
LDVPSPWGIYFQDSATPAKRFGKSLVWAKLSNSGDSLKIMVPNCSRKTTSGWSNYSCTVISHNMIEREMGYRGSKSMTDLSKPTSHKSVIVKEQRVDGSWHAPACLRCTLTGFERNYQVKNPSNQIINTTRNGSNIYFYRILVRSSKKKFFCFFYQVYALKLQK